MRHGIRQVWGAVSSEQSQVSIASLKSFKSRKRLKSEGGKEQV